MAAKLVVTAHKGGSRIALVGASGTELLVSRVFTEPRAKGATLRSLKGMLGADIVVEDHTLSSARGRSSAATVMAGSESVKGAVSPARRSAPRRRVAASSK